MSIANVTVQFDLTDPDEAELYLELVQKIIAKQDAKRVQPARGIPNGTQILPASVESTTVAVDLPDVRWVTLETAVYTPTGDLDETTERYMVNRVCKAFL